jgi:hypothetical protein
MLDVVVPLAVLLSTSLPAASLQRSFMPFDPLVDFVELGSTFVVEGAEPALVAFVPPAVPDVAPEPLPEPEPEPFDCAMDEVAKAMVSRDAERSLVIIVESPGVD